MAQWLPGHTVQIQSMPIIPESSHGTASGRWFSTRGDFAPGTFWLSQQGVGGAAGIWQAGSQIPTPFPKGIMGTLARTLPIASGPSQGPGGELTGSHLLVSCRVNDSPGGRGGLPPAPPAGLRSPTGEQRRRLRPRNRSPKHLDPNHASFSHLGKTTPCVLGLPCVPAGCCAASLPSPTGCQRHPLTEAIQMPWRQSGPG